jgi:glycosyltransferase involved in cell wall biosynthesis
MTMDITNRRFKRLRPRTASKRDFEFVGSIDDRKKWDLYKKAQLFVLPSYSENFGMVHRRSTGLWSAGHHTRATPWSELHEHRCGWWTETGVDALVTGLREAFDLNDAERREMGQRGRQLVATNYTWSGVAAKCAWRMNGCSEKLPNRVV